MVDLSQLVSHRFRGFSQHENTVEGLTSALDFGVKQIEFDIRVARCGTPLIYHDEWALDGSRRLLKICEIMAKNRAELGGAFSHMPTVETLFEAAAAHPNKAKLLVDMKDAGFEEMYVALAAANGLLDQIFWVSWLPETLYAIRDLLPKAELTLSHWCKNPNDAIRSVHRVFEAKGGNIPRPARRLVHGERSGWFVENGLSGQIRDLIDNVCVPADMVTPELVKDYQKDGIKVSAFSYVSRKAVEAASVRLGLDDYFIDAKVVFDDYA